MTITTEAPAVTKAETRAAAIAQVLADSGYRVTIRVTDHPAERFSDGRIMLAGFRSVGLTATRRVYDSTLHGHWITWTDTETSRPRTTRYMTGSIHQFTRRAPRRCRTERSLRCWAETLAVSPDGTGSVTYDRIVSTR